MEDCRGDAELVKQQLSVLNSDLANSSVAGGANDDGDDGTDEEGVDDRIIHCFLEAGLQAGTLRSVLTEKECIFLVNLINQENKKVVLYEQFLDFILPHGSKKVSGRLLRKVKRKEKWDIKKQPYEVFCTFAKLVEVEIEIKKKVQRQIQKFHARIIGQESGKGDL